LQPSEALVNQEFFQISALVGGVANAMANGKAKANANGFLCACAITIKKCGKC
jgi:hypothetical protein